jgi:hypothetical protein
LSADEGCGADEGCQGDELLASMIGRFCWLLDVDLGQLLDCAASSCAPSSKQPAAGRDTPPQPELMEAPSIGEEIELVWPP